MNVRLALVGETPVSFAFCIECEWKGWDAAGKGLPLSSILQLASTR